MPIHMGVLERISTGEGAEGRTAGTDQGYVVLQTLPSRAGSLPQGLRYSCGSELAREER
ncbi:hypothetical protein EMIT0P265_80276 [Pseudomonas zeae]